MATTSIEWTKSADGSAGQTWNPLVGCTIKSAGCTSCYAMRMASRLALMGQKRYEGATKKIGKIPVWTGRVTPDPDALTIPLHRKKPTTWFVNSMSDLFWGDDEDLLAAKAYGTVDPKPVPFDFIDRVFAVMALCPQHTFQILTKRPARMAAYLGAKDEGVKQNGQYWFFDGRTHPREKNGDGSQRKLGVLRFTELGAPWPLPNVWLGTSVENQKTADERIPHLLRVPAAVRFLSCEPLLGAINLEGIHANNEGASIDYGHGPGKMKPVLRSAFNVDAWYGIAVPGEAGDYQQIHERLTQHFIGKPILWVIIGGESGPGARPCDIAWIRSLVSQCRAAGVPAFVKQVGAKPYEHADNGPAVRSWGDAKIVLNGDFIQLYLKDRKGGTMSEWPADLRIREMPTYPQSKIF